MTEVGWIRGSFFLNPEWVGDGVSHQSHEAYSWEARSIRQLFWEMLSVSFWPQPLVDRGEQHPGLEKELTLPRRQGGFQSPKFPGGVDGQSPRGRPLSRCSKLTVGHWNFCVWVTTIRPGNEVPSQGAYLDHHILSGGKTKFITSLFYQAIYFFLESHYYYFF